MILGISIGMIVGWVIAMAIFETSPTYHAAEYRFRIASIVLSVLVIVELLYLIVR